MSKAVVSLASFRVSDGDWTNAEIAEFHRALALLHQAGLPIDTDRGLTDEGDPWFVYCHGETGEVIAHLARLDGRYVLATSALDHPVTGRRIRDVVDGFLESFRASLPLSLSGPDNTTGQRRIFLHPAAALTALIATLFLMSELTASEAHAASPAKSDDGALSGPDPARFSTLLRAMFFADAPAGADSDRRAADREEFLGHRAATVIASLAVLQVLSDGDLRHDDFSAVLESTTLVRGHDITFSFGLPALLHDTAATSEQAIIDLAPDRDGGDPLHGSTTTADSAQIAAGGDPADLIAGFVSTGPREAGPSFAGKGPLAAWLAMPDLPWSGAAPAAEMPATGLAAAAKAPHTAAVAATDTAMLEDGSGGTGMAAGSPLAADTAHAGTTSTAPAQTALADDFSAVLRDILAAHDNLLGIASVTDSSVAAVLGKAATGLAGSIGTTATTATTGATASAKPADATDDAAPAASVASVATGNAGSGQPQPPATGADAADDLQPAPSEASEDTDAGAGHAAASAGDTTAIADGGPAPADGENVFPGDFTATAFDWLGHDPIAILNAFLAVADDGVSVAYSGNDVLIYEMAALDAPSGSIEQQAISSIDGYDVELLGLSTTFDEVELSLIGV
ncbi:MAG: hypothetical protein R3D33_06270 [Hyphomicrobiaceae bacterium]